MIQASNRIKVALVSALSSGLGVNVYSFMKPTTEDRYVILDQVAETALDEKRAFLSQGTVAINIIEKFAGRSGNMDWVDSASIQVAQELTPTRLSAFGDLSGITIFSMRITDTSEDLRENETGRTAVKTLRLEYKFQTT
jgi:hypothetical protein